MFFIADDKEYAPKLAGQIRTELAKRLGLIDEDRFEMCFIVDFPMYEADEDTGRIGFTHNPFSMPQGGIKSLLNKEPLDIFAYQYDIVCNGVELSSGAVRNHDTDIMIKAFEIAGYTEDDLQSKFSALFNAFKYGAPPHAGMAPGIDRIVMLLTGEENIREVIAFPTREDIIKIAKLAKLSVEEDEIEQLTKDMSEIISFADTINTAVEDEDTEFDDINNIVNAFHEDEVIESFHRDEILKNREGGENGCFLVKKRVK